jgi:hypothetical protein
MDPYETDIDEFCQSLFLRMVGGTITTLKFGWLAVALAQNNIGKKWHVWHEKHRPNLSS